MRFINILGVTFLFFPIFLKYKSKRALSVFINGVIFHSNENNNFLRYYDIICNAIMCYYTYSKYPPALKYILFSFFNFAMNSYLYENKYISLVNSDFYHVFFVQSPLAVCLNKVKRIQ
jgi:hypothetical protein